jgi:flagellar hook-associated protein FlgK
VGDFIVKKDVDRVPVNEVAADEKVVTDNQIARTSPAAALKPQNFKSAFAEARSAGDKTFEFGGKKYTTDLAKPSVSSKRETTVEDVFPVLTGEKKRAEEKMDKKQFRAEQNAQIIAREAAKAKAKKSETRTPKRAGNLTDMLGLSSRYASGGAVSASRRGDGIAQRGKTRGRVC